MIERGANVFPLVLKPEHSLLHAQTDELQANLSVVAAKYLANLGAVAEDLFYHVLAVLSAPSYGAENTSALRNDWPRIPLPATKPDLLASAALGRELAALLDPEVAVPRSAKCLKALGPVTASDGTLDPDAGDLDVTAGWGHTGKGGVTMPGKGRIALREMTPDERAGIPEGAVAILGVQTCDVWLNDRAYWRNIPLTVWEYTLGGYQVIKKWLSYREKELLGRSLTVEEARYVTEMSRRIAAILLLSPTLDANYSAAKQATYDLAQAAKA